MLSGKPEVVATGTGEELHAKGRTMKPTREQVREVAEALVNIYDMPFPVPAPTLGIDLDGCIDECPVFFRTLTAVWPGDVVVITFRQDREKAVQDLRRFGIRHTKLVLVKSLEAKAEVISDLGISTYFDDQPQTLRDILPNVNVMLVRNGGNFDFDAKQWLFSERTGRLV